MSIWAILEIEATEDQRSIKRAYAKKLKVTKPDEDPEGFKALHQAYKSALQQAKYLRTISEEPQEQDDELQFNAAGENEPYSPIENMDTQSIELERMVTEDAFSGSQISNDRLDDIFDNTIKDESENDLKTDEIEQDNHDSIENDLDNAYDQEWIKVRSQIDELMSLHAKRLDAKQWMFLYDSPYILDPAFSWPIGLYILQVVHRNNTENQWNVIGSRVLSSLNQIFHWTAHWDAIEQDLGSNLVGQLIDLIDDEIPTQIIADGVRGGKIIEDKHSPITGPSIRRYKASPEAFSSAKYVDLTIALLFSYVFVLMLSQVTLPVISQYGLWIFLGMFHISYALLFSTSVSCFKFQTPGHWLVGIQLYDISDKTIPFKRALLQNLLSPVYFFLSLWNKFKKTPNLWIAKRLNWLNAYDLRAAKKTQKGKTYSQTKGMPTLLSFGFRLIFIAIVIFSDVIVPADNNSNERLLNLEAHRYSDEKIIDTASSRSRDI